MAVATKTKATKPEVKQPPVAEAETTPAKTFSPDQMAGIARYNEAYKDAVHFAANAGPITGEALVHAHYRARTQLRSAIAVSDAVCPTCGGTKIAV